MVPFNAYSHHLLMQKRLLYLFVCLANGRLSADILMQEE